MYIFVYLSVCIHIFMYVFTQPLLLEYNVTQGHFTAGFPGKGVAPSQHLGVVAIEKGAFWSPSTTVTNFTTGLN